jgi:hypothetical protein
MLCWVSIANCYLYGNVKGTLCGEWITLLLCVWKVQGSDLVMQIDYSNMVFVVFSSPFEHFQYLIQYRYSSLYATSKNAIN